MPNSSIGNFNWSNDKLWCLLQAFYKKHKNYSIVITTHEGSFFSHRHSGPQSWRWLKHHMFLDMLSIETHRNIISQSGAFPKTAIMKATKTL